jgi:hypothetical protein
MASRTNFAYYIQRKQLIDENNRLGLNLYPTTNDASIITGLQTGATTTTPSEYIAIAQNAGATVPPAPLSTEFLYSKNNITSGGFPIGGSVVKDMIDKIYTSRINPYTYQSIFFPGMADFIDANILQGDKSIGDRLIASYWMDLGNDVFDDWGYFYIYDVASGKYYFPLINPQNLEDGILTTQTFNVFGRTYTIQHGWAVEGIFKMDISVNDNSLFRFGAYGNMGSDRNETIEGLTYNYTIENTDLTLYYHRDQETGNLIEQLYSYFIPKKVSQNNSQTYTLNYNSDNMSIVSNEITNGLIVYFSKTNDVKEWVVNDLEFRVAQ